MKTLQGQQTKRLIIRLPTEVDSELMRLAHECGRRQASLLTEALEEWLHRQELRIETLDETPATVAWCARQDPAPLATIRF